MKRLTLLARDVRRLAIPIIVVACFASVSGIACGPSKTPPKEGDISRIPPDALASFRRAQPNAIILRANEVDKGNWELLASSPRREKKKYLYSPQGDLLKKW